MGNIYVKVYPKQAPISTNAFLKSVDEKVYDRGSFYRVLNKENQASDAVKSELIQGGIWLSNPKKAQSIKIAHEGTNLTKLQHKTGAISLARQDTGTAGTEFFILLKDDPGYDYGGSANKDKQGYAAFGEVISGMEVVYKIYNQNTVGQSLEKPISIFKIRRE